MSCRSCRKACPNYIVSSNVTFAGGNLVINIPQGAYGDGRRYCIFVNQAIPAATTINAPVYITIGASATLYPLNRCDCTQVTACAMRTRTCYPVTVRTTPTGGSFRVQCDLPCAPNNALASLPVVAAAAAREGDAG